jgi:hypothetical protein
MRSGGSGVSAGAVRAAGVSLVPGESGAERRERRCGRRRAERRERRAYRESGMEGCAELEGVRGAEGGAVSPPASARPAENLGERGREGGREYRGWVGEGGG